MRSLLVATLAIAVSLSDAHAKEFPKGHPITLTPQLMQSYRTPDESSPKPETEFRLFTSKYGNAARVIWSPYAPAARFLWGFRAKEQSGTPERIAQAFLSQWSRLLMISETADLEYRGTRFFASFAKVRFQQVFGPRPNRLDVRWAGIDVYISNDDAVWQVVNLFVPRVSAPVVSKFKAEECLDLAKKQLPIQKFRGRQTTSPLMILPQPKNDLLVYELIVPAFEPFGTWEVVVDAIADCKVLATRDLIRYAEPVGRIFNPNPIVDLRDSTLRPDSNIPENAYAEVPLLELSPGDTLTGRFATTAATEPRTRAAGGAFRYVRPSREFSETMAYHHVTMAMKYLDSLALKSPKVNDPPLRVPVLIDAYGRGFDVETSCFLPDTQTVTLGANPKLPDAEDGHVIVHELGHAVLDYRSPRFDKSWEAQAVAEGFADYLAISLYSGRRFEPTCFAPWAGAATERTTTPPCLRKIDSPMTFNTLVPWRQRDSRWVNSILWSGTLWDLRMKLSGQLHETKIDLLIIEAHSGLPDIVTFGFAGRQLLLIDQLLFDGKHYGQIAEILRARKIDFENR